MHQPSTARPIFIIGPARSGTTIITSALIAGAGIEGFREGHFLPLMTHLNRTIDNFYNTKKGVRNNPKHRDLVKDCSIEIDQWRIATEPENSARQIAEFLELGDRERQQMGHIFANKRPQSTGRDVLEKPLDIHDAGWSDQQIEVFRKTCGDLSTVLGYSETSSYFSEN